MRIERVAEDLARVTDGAYILHQQSNILPVLCIPSASERLVAKHYSAAV